MNDHKDKQLKLRPHGSGQGKQSVTYGKFHDTIILKIQAIYDNVTKIENSIRASEIVDINQMAPESYISEDLDVKKEELQQRSFYI